jgi:hypothetical protein
MASVAVSGAPISKSNVNRQRYGLARGCEIPPCKSELLVLPKSGSSSSLHNICDSRISLVQVWRILNRTPANFAFMVSILFRTQRHFKCAQKKLLLATPPILVVMRGGKPTWFGWFWWETLYSSLPVRCLEDMLTALFRSCLKTIILDVTAESWTTNWQLEPNSLLVSYYGTNGFPYVLWTFIVLFHCTYSLYVLRPNICSGRIIDIIDFRSS